MNIYQVVGDEMGGTEYYIDCPVDTFDCDMLPQEKLKRMRIPKALALYIYTLQEKIRKLEAENADS